MPIKFRCQHCQQLLGISRSRAEALVDCPQCGRSLRVPSLDGTTQAVPNVNESARDDDDLLSALTQLSELAVTEDDPSERLEAEPGHVTEQNAVSGEALPNAKPVELPEPSFQPPQQTNSVVEETAELRPEYEPLSELAGSFLLPAPGADSPAASLSRKPESLTPDGGSYDRQNISDPDFDIEPASAFPGPRWWAVATLLMMVSLAVGWWTGRATSTGNGDASPGTSEVAEDAAGIGAVERRPHEEAVVASLHGKVMYEDASGRRLPDEFAMLILLPTTRQGSLLLSSRGLRREANHPDFRAVVAALEVLGGALTEAGADGGFTLGATATGTYTLVAISRHVERPDDLPVPDVISDILSRYFDSVSHIPGRLAAESVTIEVADSNSIAIELPAFGRNP